jgi:hypothetical protein
MPAARSDWKYLTMWMRSTRSTSIDASFSQWPK